MSPPPSTVCPVRCAFIRHRNVLLTSADLTPLFDQFHQHLQQFRIHQPPALRPVFRDFLAGFLLHAASRPRTEQVAWTLHFQEPHFGIFLTADCGQCTVTGRLLTEGLKKEETNFFYQDLAVRGREPHRSIVPFEGHSAKAAIEFFCLQSEQRPAKLFNVTDNTYTLFRAHPDFDAAWFRALTRKDLPALPSDEIVRDIERRPFQWHCGCRQQRILDALLLPFLDDPGAVFGSDESITVNCPRCASRHTVSREAMEARLRDAAL